LTALSYDGVSLRSSFLQHQGSSDIDIFELDEDGNILDSPHQFILPVPSGAATAEGSELDNPPSSLRFPSPEIPVESFPNSQELSPELPIPDYDIYTTAELKSKISQYGFKPSSNRKQMIKDLEKIYSCIHSNSQTSVVSQKRATTDSETGTSLPVPSSQTSDHETRKKIINHIKSNPTLMNKILNFEASRIKKI
jgi:hypothetical protein